MRPRYCRSADARMCTENALLFAHGSWILCSVSRVRSKTMHSLFCITSLMLPYIAICYIDSRSFLPLEVSRTALLGCRLARLLVGKNSISSHAIRCLSQLSLCNPAAPLKFGPLFHIQVFRCPKRPCVVLLPLCYWHEYLDMMFFLKDKLVNISQEVLPTPIEPST